MYGLAESKGMLAVKKQVATKGPQRDNEITLTPTSGDISPKRIIEYKGWLLFLFILLT